MESNSDWVPAWAKQAIWYQIFPERFRNGNPRSNPTLADLDGAWPQDQTSAWQIHPWTSDWYELQPYEAANGQGFVYNAVRRRYGGDLQGILDKLDYLQDLGVTALYLNPIFDSPSHHKYDGLVYHHVDRTLGPDPLGDRALMAKEDPADPATWVWTAADRQALELVAAVHARGMRIIFDGVFNHVSSASPFFRDVVARQRRSPYADWFSIDSWDDPEQGTRFAYKGWFGVAELPEWRQDESGTVAGPRDYIFASTRRWMAPFGSAADGIDGWRLDVAFCVKHPFWKAWRSLVKSINPEAYLTAEVIDPIDVLKPYLQGDEFDAVMNYTVAFACAEFFIDQQKRISVSAFDARLRALRDAFDPCVAYVQQNLIDSHDSNRVGSHIVNRDGVPFRDWSTYHGVSKAVENPAYDPRKPTVDEVAVQKLIVLFMMTYVGAPMIYYGDEVGMWGANDPCCRKPMLWPELTYDPEVYRPDGSRRTAPDAVAVDHDLYETYRRLIQLRRDNPALSLGDFKTVLVDEARSLYAYRRGHAGRSLFVVLNNSGRTQRVDLPLPAGRWSDLLESGRTIVAREGHAEVEVPARWGVVLAGD